MFKEQPRFASPPGSGDVKIQNYQQMLVVINHVLTTAPEYNDTGMVGFPINAILDFPMITSAGLAAFRLQSLNDMLRKVLAVWTGVPRRRQIPVRLERYPDWMAEPGRQSGHPSGRIPNEPRSSLPRLQELERFLYPPVQSRGRWGSPTMTGSS